MSYLTNFLGVLYKTKLKEFHLILMAFGLGVFIILLGFLNNHLNNTHRSQIYFLQRANLELSYAHIWLDEFMSSENRSIGSNNPTELSLLKAKQDVRSLLNFKESPQLFKIFNKTIQKQLNEILNHINKINISANVCINEHISNGTTPDIYSTHDIEFNSLKQNIDLVYNKLILRLNKEIKIVRLSQYILFTILLIHIILTVLVIKNIRYKLLERENRLKKAQEIAKLGFYTYNYNTEKWTISKSILKLIDFPEDNNIYKSWLSIIHPDDMEIVKKALKKTEKPLDLIYRIYDNSCGKIIWVHHVSSPIKKEPKTQNLTVLGTIQDITEKRKLESDFLHAFIDAQEHEKQSFGEELHDGMSQILAAENMYIETLLKINKDKTDTTFKHLSTLKDLNLSAIEEARNIAHGLMSKHLKEKGLLEAVAHICKDYNHSKNVKFKFEKHGIDEKEITGEIKTNLFRLTQEISTNIIRHSGASTAIISIIKTTGNQLKLNIEDNGVGMDLKKMKQENKGAGLKNIERRVKLLNGELNLETSPNKGTSYTITVPL